MGRDRKAVLGVQVDIMLYDTNGFTSRSAARCRGPWVGFATSCLLIDGASSLPGPGYSASSPPPLILATSRVISASGILRLRKCCTSWAGSLVGLGAEDDEGAAAGCASKADGARLGVEE